jgi:hypothetical protein
MFGATNIKVLQKLCWRCPAVFCFCVGSLDVGDAPASIGHVVNPHIFKLDKSYNFFENLFV